ncbi:hypothetical protein PG996_008419 [Apiospora saccharicola]|uniref:Uncharacterized protein n=1 Tax=Apiospora saccharicola TaxID=335842 RepID=A0ABR1UXV1_9PEZI
MECTECTIAGISGIAAFFIFFIRRVPALFIFIFHHGLRCLMHLQGQPLVSIPDIGSLSCPADGEHPQTELQLPHVPIPHPSGRLILATFGPAIELPL